MCQLYPFVMAWILGSDECAHLSSEIAASLGHGAQQAMLCKVLRPCTKTPSSLGNVRDTLTMPSQAPPDHQTGTTTMRTLLPGTGLGSACISTRAFSKTSWTSPFSSVKTKRLRRRQDERLGHRLSVLDRWPGSRWCWQGVPTNID